MLDEDKTFSDSSVLDLRIRWRYVHTLYCYHAWLQLRYLFQSDHKLMLGWKVYRFLREKWFLIKHVLWIAADRDPDSCFKGLNFFA